METINYSAMSDGELKYYFLQHREDKLALENYLNRVNNRSYEVITTVDDPDFDAKIHAVTKQKILNNNNDKSSIENIYQEFQQKSSDLLKTPWNLGISNLNRLIKFIDTTPIIYDYIQQRVLSYPIEEKDNLKDSTELKKLCNSIVNEGINGKDISFFYWLLKFFMETNETNKDDGYFNLAMMLVDPRLIDNNHTLFQALVDKFNKDLLQPYFINHIKLYLKSIIMEDQKKQVNAGRNIYYYDQSGQFGIGHMSDSEIKDQAKVAGVINEADQRNLAEVAKEIQQLLDQLSETYPTTTSSEKCEVVTKAIKVIENNSLLTSRIIRVLKAAGTEALKQAINRPSFSIFMASLEALKEN